MARHLFVVMTNAAEGHEEAFNDWYDNVHLADVMKIAGFQSAQRFRLAPDDADNPRARQRYLAIYEVDTDSVARTKAEVAAATGTEAMPVSSTLDLRTGAAFWYEPIGEKKLAK